MNPDLWTDCDGPRHVAPLRATVLRVVESQEQAATLGLVDTLAEQAALEELLERTKPPLPAATAGLDYLLATPFRYPPLRHGSRFGRRTEGGIFYAAFGLTTALAECAYYRFVFYAGMASPPPAGRLHTQHTSFKAKVATERGLRLDQPPWDRWRAGLASPTSYAITQPLGTRMREAGIGAARYVSARDPRAGHNLAVFSPTAIAARRPADMTAWACTTAADRVTFVDAHGGTGHEFLRSQFLVDGLLPVPGL